MFQVVVTTSAKKSIKRLPPAIRQEIHDQAEGLAINPYLGMKLTGSLCFLYSLHFSFGGVQYRIAYTINKEENQIVIYLAGTRENFYNKLRLLFR